MRTPSDELNNDSNDLHEHYDFDYTKAKPNRFAAQLSQEALMIVLEPEVAAAFPTAEAVNEALRMVMRLSQIPAPQVGRRGKRKVVGA